MQTATPSASRTPPTRTRWLTRPSRWGSLGGRHAAEHQKAIHCPEAPLNKLAFNATYTIPFNPGDLSLSASYIYRDTENGTIFDRKYDNAPSYTQVDLRALWKSHGDKYEIIGYVKNVFDTIGFQAADGFYNGFNGNASQTAQPGGQLFQSNVFNETPPRTYGVEVRYKFF